LRIAGPEVIWMRLAIRNGSGIVRIVATLGAVTIWVWITILSFSVCGNNGPEYDN
jgi:hypothetical protein